jgi:catechol 2,3-dioxygenase-like lactoylglutathione lyase family enzyme
MNILKPHVSLNVRHIEESVAFYSKVFGVAPVKLRPGYAKFDLHSPQLNLTMEQHSDAGSGSQRNASHFGVQVAAAVDVLAAKASLEAAGLRTFVEENVACCYSVSDKVWVEDPDGNAWEFFVVKGESDVLHAQANVNEVRVAETNAENLAAAPCCAPSCCPK